MKIILSVIFLFVIISIEAQSFSKPVYLFGIIKNAENLVQVEDMSELSELQFPNLERTFLPDSAGNFSISFQIHEGNYFRIGRNALFIQPGDTLYMEIDFEKPSKALFRGGSALANTYLKSNPYPKAGSFLESGDNIKTTVEETIATVIKIAEERKILLESYASELSKDFLTLEHARINSDIINSLIQIQIYFPYVNKLDSSALKIFYNSYESQIQPYIKKYSKGMLNSSFLKLVVYRSIVNELTRNFEENTVPQSLKDWQYSKALFSKIKQQNNLIDTISLLHSIDKVKIVAYKQKLKDALAESLKLKNGDAAIDFTASNNLNEKVRLSYFKGKVIYIKIWATWCEPCITEFADYDNLREIFESKSSIVFISLSIDESTARWTKFNSGRSNLGINWIIDRSLLNRYSVVEIPRTIVINKDFKIAALYGPSPSNPKILDFLRDMLDEGIKN